MCMLGTLPVKVVFFYKKKKVNVNVKDVKRLKIFDVANNSFFANYFFSRNK